MTTGSCWVIDFDEPTDGASGAGPVSSTANFHGEHKVAAFACDMTSTVADFPPAAMTFKFKLKTTVTSIPKGALVTQSFSRKMMKNDPDRRGWNGADDLGDEQNEHGTDGFYNYRSNPGLKGVVIKSESNSNTMLVQVLEGLPSVHPSYDTVDIDGVEYELDDTWTSAEPYDNAAREPHPANNNMKKMPAVWYLFRGYSSIGFGEYVDMKDKMFKAGRDFGNLAQLQDEFVRDVGVMVDCFTDSNSDCQACDTGTTPITVEGLEVCSVCSGWSQVPSLHCLTCPDGQYATDRTSCQTCPTTIASAVGTAPMCPCPGGSGLTKLSTCPSTDSDAGKFDSDFYGREGSNYPKEVVVKLSGFSDASYSATIDSSKYMFPGAYASKPFTVNDINGFYKLENDKTSADPKYSFTFGRPSFRKITAPFFRIHKGPPRGWAPLLDRCDRSSSGDCDQNSRRYYPVARWQLDLSVDPGSYDWYEPYT